MKMIRLDILRVRGTSGAMSKYIQWTNVFHISHCEKNPNRPPCLIVEGYFNGHQNVLFDSWQYAAVTDF